MSTESKGTDGVQEISRERSMNNGSTGEAHAFDNNVIQQQQSRINPVIPQSIQNESKVKPSAD